MANKKKAESTENKENKKKSEGQQDKPKKSKKKKSAEPALDEKAETKKKIEKVMKAKGGKLEKAAEEIAPDFDYEAEAKRLAFEERGEEILKRKGPLPPAQVDVSEYPPEKKVYTSWFGRAFLKDRHAKVLGLTILLFIAVCAWQGIDYYIPETVHVTYQALDRRIERDVYTRAKTVGEFVEELKAAGYDIADTDQVTPPMEKPVSDDMKVKVFKAEKTKARIAGDKREFWLIPGTVEANLEFNGIAYDEDDEIKPALDKTVNMDTKIVVDEVHYVTEDKQEEVKATDKVILDPKLTSGVEEKTEGNDGEGIFTYKYKYVNGKKKDTEKKVKKWIVEPHDNVLRLGTSLTGQKGTYIVTRTFTANCTAYTSRVNAPGSLGLGVHYGTCAVDPKFVPYRSEMWIAGYGYAFANDCGGAVKRNVVDLWMSSNSACIRWGRRNCTAYILERVEDEEN